jgi:hypothetical protein
MKLWALIGLIVLLVQASAVWGQVRIVPGTPSFIDLHIEGFVRINGITADELWDVDRHRLVGVSWPGETHPPFPGDWTLDETHRVDDGPDFTEARTKSEFDYDYAGLRTDVLLRALSEGVTDSGSPGDDEFQAWSWMTGQLVMWLTSDSIADPAGPYDVQLVITITGSDLSTLGSASAVMDHFVRVTPFDDGDPIVFNAVYSDIIPPPLNTNPPPKYRAQAFFSFAGVPLDPGGQTPFATVELGVGGAHALSTLTDGQTEAPTIIRSEAHSLFDSTLSLQFEAQPAADLNGDGCVNFVDFAIFADWWRNTCATPDWCDGANFDDLGQVDLVDLAIFVGQWLEGCD